MRRKRAAIWRIPTTVIPLCRGDIAKCISANIPINRFTDEQRIRPATSPSRPHFSLHFRSTAHSDGKRATDGADDRATSPAWISGSGDPIPVAVVSDRQPAVIYSSVDESDSELDFYYDADSAVVERVAVIVRHLGLVVGIGACALAVGVVAVVTAIACRYRAATRESAPGVPVAHNGYRRAATDEKRPSFALDDDGRPKNGYRYPGGYGRPRGRWWPADATEGDAAAARASLIRCDGDGDAFVTSSVTMTSSSSRRGHATEWFV